MFNNSDNLTYERKAVGVDVQPLLRVVYLWMTFGLLSTAAVSAYIGFSPALATRLAPFYMPIVIIELITVFVIGWAVRRISAPMGAALFLLYSILNGITFGVIFAALIGAGEVMAIAQAFFTTAGLFGAMTVVGFTTNVNLSKYSTFFMMALIGLIIAIVVNLFLGSSMLGFVISVFGVLLFTALTAYDTQRIAEMAYQPEYQNYSDATFKMGILGALILYLDFINLFWFLLSLFSGRD